ncbi:MAG TPA: YdeI/OmpD-associated family protein [Acidimicrobiia bacterium]
MAADHPPLVVTDADAWRSWLGANHARSAGVWLLLSKQGTVNPTSLTYEEALEEALSYGWIDGQLRRADDTTYSRRFTPRGSRSGWSKRNVSIIERLMSEGRMHPAGLAEVERARADGRWDTAYAGGKTIEVPADFAAALRAEPRAQATFEKLTRQNRYSLLYRIETAKRSDTRARRIDQFVAMLARGETIHPQRRTPTQ